MQLSDFYPLDTQPQNSSAYNSKRTNNDRPDPTSPGSAVFAQPQLAIRPPDLTEASDPLKALAPPQVQLPDKPSIETPAQQQARITFYYRGEDPFGDITSKPGPDGHNLAHEGTTIAVDPSVIPYGSGVNIPGLKDVLGHDSFYAHDTGSDVVSRKASQGRDPVIDVYLDAANAAEGASKAAKMEQKLKSLIPNYNGYLPFGMLGKLKPTGGQKVFAQ